MFSFESNADDVVLSKSIDYSAIYGNEALKSDQVIFTQKEKTYIHRGHSEDIEWLSKNQDLVLKAITNPLFIDTIPRLHDKTAFNIAHIVYVGDQELPFLNVVLSFHRDGRPVKIWTMFRAGKRFIYELSGERKSRWRKP